MHIEISTRHGHLEPTQHAYLHERAEKLQRVFSRLMGVEIAVEHVKHAWDVELLVSAEHKHDFVAREQGSSPEAAMDGCVQKLEQQLRKYKDQVQRHRGRTLESNPSQSEPELPDRPPIPSPEC